MCRLGIQGKCDAQFAAVRSAFEENFASRQELGAAVAVYLDGQLVVHLWGGYRDWARTRPWNADTLASGFSIGKTLAAECIHLLVERGRAKWDDAIADHWPEFAVNGKDDITIRMLLCHQAGLPAVRRTLPLWAEGNWTLMTSALAQERPWWVPGTEHGYHVGTYGFLVGELLRRLSGVSLPEFFERELARPLKLDIHFTTSAKLAARTAQVVRTHARSSSRPRSSPSREELLSRVYDNPVTVIGSQALGDGDEAPYEAIPANEPRWREACNPGCNVGVTAESVARYAAMHASRGSPVDSPRVFSIETLSEATREHTTGVDRVLALPMSYAMGFKRWQRHRKIGPNWEDSYFANGFGGSIALVDPNARLGFAYIMNAPLPRSFLTERNVPLIEATYESL